MRIVVCVKHVPDTTADRGFEPDGTTDRESVDSLLSELDEYAVEQALRLVESGLDAEITYLTLGPDDAKGALRKALAMGGDRAVHISDEAVAGTDALGTSLILARAVERLGFDLVITGMAATDSAMGVLPAMLAERLGVPGLTRLDEFEVEAEAGTVTGRREGEAASLRITASVPAVVSVTDRSGEARYPSFKGIMSAKKKPLDTLGLAELGLDAEQFGLAAAGSAVDGADKRPARVKGEVVADEGDGGTVLAAFLATRKFI